MSRMADLDIRLHIAADVLREIQPGHTRNEHWVKIDTGLLIARIFAGDEAAAELERLIDDDDDDEDTTPDPDCPMCHGTGTGPNGEDACHFCNVAAMDG